MGGCSLVDAGGVREKEGITDISVDVFFRGVAAQRYDASVGEWRRTSVKSCS